jgi:hypothetical protein
MDSSMEDVQKIKENMKRWLILITITLSLSHCVRKDHSSELQKDFDAVIVGMNGSDAYISYRSPVRLKSVVFKVLDKDLYLEMDSETDVKIITKQWFYNHRTGDTVHFDYVRKDRFFQITRKFPSEEVVQEDSMTREERLFGESQLENQ